MPKYVCIKSQTESVPEGTVIIAAPISAERIVLIQDSELITGEYSDKPFFERGDEIPLNGQLWHWEEVKNHVL